MSTSYSDILRIYIRAWRFREQANKLISTGKLKEAYELLIKALVEMVKTLLLYHGRRPLSVRDLIYVSSMAVEEGLLSPREYSLIIEAIIGKNLEYKLKQLNEIINIVEERLRRIDPYLDSQMKLFRY